MKAEKQLPEWLEDESEHAMELINQLDEKLILLDKISHRDAETIKSLLHKAHPSLNKNLNINKFDFTLIYEFENSFDGAIKFDTFKGHNEVRQTYDYDGI